MDERLRFVQDVHRPGWSIAELCRRYEVSRKTGYKWLRAYERGGPVWLGRFHEEVGRIVDQLGRPMRRLGGNHKGRNHQKVLPIT